MHRYQTEAKDLIKLASPVLIASIAQTGMGFVDTVMAGGVSAVDMAAVSIAASIWLPSILFGVGLLMAIIPVVAQLNGAGKQDQVPFQIHQGIILALMISIPTIVVLLQIEGILNVMDVESVMAEKTVGYIYAVIFAVPAFLLFQALRSYTDGMSLTKPAMVIGFIGLVVNIPLNWVFVYGQFGAPALGGVGCGIATTIVYWLMFFMMLFYVATTQRLKHIGLFSAWHKPDRKALTRLFKLGFPIAAAIFFEVTLFAVVSLLAAPLGSLVVASHQIAMNFSSLVFMIPMSIGAAVSIRVGHKLGEIDTAGAIIACRVGLIVGLAVAMFTATATLLFKQQIVYLYTDNAEVVTLAMQLLIFAAIYQCTDAIQVVAAGALRGYKDMKAIFNCTFIAYWLIGLPLGYLLAMTDVIVDKMGIVGFWFGFIVGLSAAALMLTIRLLWMHKQTDELQLEYAER
ncbi:MATE family efflux transporter [Vibrio sp. 10N.286.49.C2]|uniref:MATE family efflux transporter n=1 Tax=unclassified Vibrio TaxID=2614977 RepID=UPI000C828DF2|nr:MULTISPECIES: MATE family efflux transporter [unclassified Vibrio]PMH35221.1 MATE family efflux transporter [Vibrio sp. 10N.286.49.C2]PMH57186.1 MATE family efflux transporter [Vibrio sp. 10N.286.49.B1]PMH82364.1 MATE family efflux transporter [Vibrio sp. 10N.286.48.B7]